MYKSKFNKPLEKFKNIHNGKTAILFATGPTIKNYTPLENSEDFIKFGVNSIYDHKNIVNDLNYYFYGSHYYINSYHKKNVDETCSLKNIISFASAYEEGRSHKDINRGNISPERAIELKSVPFENNLQSFTNDVSEYATLGHSIIFPAIQIILYMGIKKIYIVGCDGGYTSGQSSGNAELILLWKKFEEFRTKYYPEVKVISVNPVSLKGLFHDIYI
tara:strand:- start:94 stop:747 length:654 start_codon:yes stop_codon:yes gene_type:complete